MLKKKILVHPSRDRLGSRIAGALERIVPIELIDYHSGRDGAAAILSVSGDASSGEDLSRLGLPCFHLASPHKTDSPAADQDNLVFSRSNLLDTRLTGRRLRHLRVAGIPSVNLRDSDIVLASCLGEPVWIARQSRDRDLEIVGASLPVQNSATLLYDQFNPRELIPWLPILHFLRRVSADLRFRAPQLQACLMFDDPNLHWDSYGFLPYREILRRAQNDNYHVAFATVPLDTWYSNQSAVALFRDYPQRLSLLFHGNDHLKSELGRSRQIDQNLRLLAQARRRIARLEATTGVRVDRVMAPPHGAYTNSALEAMQRLGFEGACISQGSLRGRNPGYPWNDAFGLEYAQMMDRGFPVLPRFRLSADAETAIVFAAFMNQPIIPVGHHDTVSGGIELLSSVASIINSLGDVRWNSPQEMLRSGSVLQLQGNTVHIRPFSFHSMIEPPPDADSITLDNEFSIAGTVSLVYSDGRTQPMKPGERYPLSSRKPIQILVSTGETMDYNTLRPLPPSPWAVARRLLCESRDRFAPFLARLRGTRHA